jgi:transcriptional/translational regulatory protein YebC/TACO1
MIETAEVTMVAQNTVPLESDKARQALRLIETLDDLEDVQRVTANFDIPEDVFAEIAG